MKKILDNKNIEIPKSYFDYLKSKNFKSELTIFEDEDDFNLYNLDELCEEIIVDDERVLQIEVLKGYIKTILEVNDDFFDLKEKQEYEKLAKCLSIGYRNSDVLFIDRDDNNTLHIFYPDGGDTEQVDDLTLKDIIQR